MVNPHLNEMTNPHLNFSLKKEDHELAKEVKKNMKCNNWAECFMKLIKAEKKRSNQ